MSKLPYLNLGCGYTYHKNWTNVDFISTGPDVMAHNLINGIPFKNDSFEAVYHSHVLEHFPKEKAVTFIKECYRVLKTDGIIRIAIPDLERIARNYLKYLEESLNNVPLAEQKYEWSLLEMYDQVIRTNSGGDMVKYLADINKGNDEFILERNGKEAENLLGIIRSKKEEVVKNISPTKTSFRNKWREKLLRRWLGNDYRELLDAATFRSQGEIHQWMYDRFSLKKLVENCGFKEARIVTAFESSIPGWNDFELDGKDNNVRKPDSLFLEAKK